MIAVKMILRGAFSFRETCGDRLLSSKTVNHRGSMRWWQVVFILNSI